MHRLAPLLITGCLCLAVPFASASAQPSAKVARAQRITDRPPRIDGRLDEALWKTIEPIDDLTQKRPLEGAAPSESTHVFIAYDDDALYVGARMFRRDPASIPRSVTRRDGFGNAESFSITLDTHLDRRTAYEFGVSAGGVKNDAHLSQDNEMRGRESQYDPIWDAQVVVDSLGWTAELRIPFSQLRFSDAEEQRWGVQLDRWIPDQNEDDMWVMVPNRETGYVSRFGTLTGIEGIHPRRPVELLPYVAGDATRSAGSDAADPFRNPSNVRLGLDAKFGIGSNLTLDATVNPDFGQVEADPAEVNLTAFETFFDERRPFFTEGAELFRGGPNFFYSRRIGGPPHVALEGDYVDEPRASTILGALKLTGRTSSRLSIGGLFAVTDAERARVFTTASRTMQRFMVEPRTAYGVLRLQQEVGTQASTVGATVTGVRRALGNQDSLVTALTRDALAGGLDWRLRFQQGRYAITGFAGFSYVGGDSMAISRIQLGSAHYFDRPDASHVSYDPSRRSMRGYTASLRADKDAGRHILWGAEVTTESPGYEVNDVGRLQSADDIDYNADIQIRETEPSRYLQNWRLGFMTRGGFDYGGTHTSNRWSQSASMTFRNLWNFNMSTQFELRAMDNWLTRGGPLMQTGFQWGQEYRINNAFGARTGWRIGFNWSRDELGSKRVELNGGLTVRPLPSWQASLDPSYAKSTDARQYLTTIVDPAATATYGLRSIFAFVDRTTVSVRGRLTYAFSPTLTLEGYGEPFVASGRYYNIGELAAPRKSALRTYGTDGTTITRADDGSLDVTTSGTSFTLDNPDFHVLSFRSNLVFRWEWNPGSTLYLVWQQNRFADDAIDDAVGVRDLWTTTRAAGDNFLALKISYWFPFSRGR